MSAKTLSIVLPCYNEAKNIPVILKRFAQVIDRNDVEVVLVDNGSTDETSHILQELLPNYPFARSVRVQVNQGYGYGIFMGLKSCDSNFLGWTHADMQTDPGDVLKGFDILENSNHPERTFVKGTRKNRPLSDQFFTTGMSAFESLVLRSLLRDINAQPNLFPKSFFDTFSQPPKDFSFDLYYYYLATKNHYKILRFNVDFGKRLYGHSHWNINWKSKLKFIRRTVEFTLSLKKKLN